jgi:hypothetical protein
MQNQSAKIITVSLINGSDSKPQPPLRTLREPGRHMGLPILLRTYQSKTPSAKIINISLISGSDKFERQFERNSQTVFTRLIALTPTQSFLWVFISFIFCKFVLYGLTIVLKS